MSYLRAPAASVASSTPGGLYLYYGTDNYASATPSPAERSALVRRKALPPATRLSDQSGGTLDMNGFNETVTGPGQRRWRQYPVGQCDAGPEAVTPAGPAGGAALAAPVRWSKSAPAIIRRHLDLHRRHHDLRRRSRNRRRLRGASRAPVTVHGLGRNSFRPWQRLRQCHGGKAGGTLQPGGTIGTLAVGNATLHCPARPPVEASTSSQSSA